MKGLIERYTRAHGEAKLEESDENIPQVCPKFSFCSLQICRSTLADGHMRIMCSDAFSHCCLTCIGKITKIKMSSNIE